MEHFREGTDAELAYRYQIGLLLPGKAAAVLGPGGSPSDAGAPAPAAASASVPAPGSAPAPAAASAPGSDSPDGSGDDNRAAEQSPRSERMPSDIASQASSFEGAPSERASSEGSSSEGSSFEKQSFEGASSEEAPSEGASSSEVTSALGASSAVGVPSAGKDETADVDAAVGESQVALGPETVDALGCGIGEQIQCLARRVSEQLSQPSGNPSRQGFIIDSVDLAFGISVRANPGNVLSVLVDPAGETNVEVTVTLKRSPELIRPASRPVFS